MYSRNNPSPKYQELVAIYRTLHLEGDAALQYQAKDMFKGYTMLNSAAAIRSYITRTHAQTILDYGCGKGQQYEARNVEIPGKGLVNSVQEYWGVDSITRYDPAYTPFSTLPEGTFDGVICTDVLEHCPEMDIPWILSELFRYAERFVYANVASYPAKKTLPNGENAHCTIQPPQWWKQRILEAAETNPDVIYNFCIINKQGESLNIEEFTGR